MDTTSKCSLTISYENDPISGSNISNTTTDYYESHFHNQPTRKVTTNSQGENLSEIFKYALDFRIPACDNIADGWQTYTTAYNSAYNTYLAGQSCVSSGNINCKWMVYQQWRYDKSVASFAIVNFGINNRTS